MIRSQGKTTQKGETNFVICHPVSFSSVPPLFLHFGRRRFFGDSFLCVFPQRRLVNVANFRHARERASTLFFLSSASILLSRTFENHSKGINDRAYDSNVKYFESVNRWKVYPFRIARNTILSFPLRFSASRKFSRS